LNVWKQQMGTLPAGDNPIDGIGEIITTNWAKPPTTLEKLRNSTDVNKILNNVPLSGGPVVPVFMNFLNALGDANVLQSLVTENRAFLTLALGAISSPSETNGGLPLSDGSTVPAYRVANSVSDILNALKNKGSKIELSMSVNRQTEDEFQVSIAGRAGFSIPVGIFFSVDVGGSASYFSSEIATSSNETTVNMTYTGVNLINYGPPPFSQAGETKNWFWMDPLTQAIRNGYPAKDATGFKFAAEPPVLDFSEKGPFSYLAGTAIANYPSVEIVVKSANYKKIENSFKQSASVGMSFLGIPLGGGSQGTYSHHATSDSASSTVTITLTPPPSMVAGNTNDSVGWILGVQPMFPAAKAKAKAKAKA